MNLHPDTPNDVSKVTVNPDLIDNDKRSRGGTRGKSEQRKHIGVKSIIGKHGPWTYFRGECWNCSHEMICQRYEKRKQLARCPECDHTSFVYKGFFSNDDYPPEEYVPLEPDECVEDIYIMVLKADLEYSKPILSYGTETDYENSVNGDFWDTVELLDTISVEG